MITKETVGTLNLKIARLEQLLKILLQKQTLSKAYPEHYRQFNYLGTQIENQLHQMMTHRNQLTN